jgi:hypothetical protein
VCPIIRGTRHIPEGVGSGEIYIIGDNEMKRLLLALAIITIAFSGCMEKEKAPSSGEVKNLMIHSAANLSAYSFQILDNQTESIKDLVKNNITNQYNISTRSVNTEVTASVNLAGRKALANVLTTTTIKSPGGLPNVVVSKGTEYNIGNTTYTARDDGNWTQLKDPTPEDALWAEGRYNLIKSRAESVNQSEVEVIGSENIDGKDCYKLRLILDNQTYSGTIYNMLTSVLFPFVPEVNETDLVKGSNIENLVWVEKDTNLPKKYQHMLSMKIAPNIIGVFDFNKGGTQKFNQSMRLVEVSLNADSIEKYYDYNKPANILVPKEALNTTPIVPSPIQVTPTSG